MIEQIRKNIDKSLASFLDTVKRDYKLHLVSPLLFESIREFTLREGKRLRPLLLILTYKGYAPSSKKISRKLFNASTCMEFLHNFMLIHDDIIDRSDLRRGRPTCHKVFGEAMAILAGDSLLTLAFEVLSRLPYIDAERKIRLVEELARASGTVGGMIGGQVHDIEGEKRAPTASLLESIHRAKTGALLRASLRMGAIYAGATQAELSALSEFGERVGLAFQIIDDVLDVEESSEKLGKTAGKDAAQQKITFPAVYGLERSRQMAEEERLAAHSALHSFDDRADPLRQIADFIVQRKA